MEFRSDTRTESGSLFPPSVSALASPGSPDSFLPYSSPTPREQSFFADLNASPGPSDRPPSASAGDRTPTPSGPSWGNAALFFRPDTLQDYSRSG